MNEIAIKGLLTFYFAQPLDALIGGLLLVYEPPLLDILPIYVLFMLASPWVMSVGLRRGWAPVLAVSTALWFLAQFGLSQWVYDAANAVVEALPMGYAFRVCPLPLPQASRGGAPPHAHP